MVIGVGSIIQDEFNNKYVLDEFLGNGGFGAVYKAHNTNESGCVAVKIFNSFSDPDTLLSFKKETNLFRIISSKYVVKYLYVHDGETFLKFPCYIIMEYCENGTLRDFINSRNGRHLNNEEIKKVFLQLAQAMKCVNDQLIHRDIKPENILNFNGIFKITDFGLSKIIGESTKTLTFKNGGTWLYMAPEAWDNSKNTIQMDIYSMGIVFYELATLKYPYSLPRNESYSDFKNMHWFETPVNPQIYNKNLQPNLASVIIKMLEKPTQSRFRNWDEIIKRLLSKDIEKDDFSSLVDKAIAKRNADNLRLLEQKSKKDEQDMLKDNKIKIAYSQYKSDVLEPIEKFAKLFNDQCANDKKIYISEYPPNISGHRFSTIITMPTGNKINIYGEVLFKENFTRAVHYDTCKELGQENYIPSCEGREIMMWCQIEDYQGYGFNVLLFDHKNNPYGDWAILKNSVNPNYSINRTSPFGFNLSELPTQIQYTRCEHIYYLDFEQFSARKIIDFIAERV